jgi:hypothetical protein
MSLAELLPEVRGLPRADKLALLQELSDELAVEKLLPPDGVYEFWSPWDSYEAAQTMLEVLAAERKQP